MRKRYSLLIGALAIAAAIASAMAAPAAAAATRLDFAADRIGAPAAGWEGSGVVEAREGVRVLHVAGRHDNDVAVTPALPARAGQQYLLSYSLQLSVAAGGLHVQFRCLDAAHHVLRPEWMYPTIEVHATSLPRPASISRKVSLEGVEADAAYVQVVFKWWGTPSGDAWLRDVSWQALGGRPPLTAVRPLDLRAECNRGFQDTRSAAGRSAGGWTGQGENDLRRLRPGTREVGGVPLVILDPATNGGRSCIVLGSTNRPGLRQRVVIPVGQRADRLFALHNSAFTGPPGAPVATWTFHYTDGASSAITLRAGIDMADWMHPEDTENSVVALTTASMTHTPVGLNLCEITNPRPDSTIRSIDIASAGAAVYGLAAVTLANGGPLMPWLKLQTQVAFEKATGQWFPAPLPWSEPDRPSPTNVSWLLDRPAGKHGFIHARNGQFVFDDGTRARFIATTAGWSTWAVPHADADKMAAYLARMGVNMLRIYPLRNITGADPRTFTLDADKQEKLDYLLAQLRRRGIYVYFYTSVDQLILSPLLPALTQGASSRSRALGLFDPTWLAAQERYWRLLLTHVNPYTGRSLAQDPMLAFLVLTNEMEMFQVWSPSEEPIPAEFRDELKTMWNRWLLQQYGSRDKLTAAWAAMGAAPLPANEDPAANTVPLADRDQRGRIFDFRRFCAAIQQRYAIRITASLRAMGVRCPVQDTNSIYTPEGVFVMDQADFSGYHLYGPYQDGYNWTEPNYSVLKTSSPLKGNQWSFPDADQLGRLAGRPFVLGEWNVGYPNDFRGGGVLQGFAYGLLQDWDCINYFCFFEDASTLRPDTPAVSGSLASAFDTGRVGLFPAIALLFYRQDITPAKQAVYRRFTHADIDRMEKDAGYPGALAYGSRSAAWIPFVHRYAIAPEPASPPPGTVIGGPELDSQVQTLRDHADQQGLIDEKGLVVRSDNGQLSSDFTHGIVTIDTPRTQGAAGSLEETPEVDLSRVRIAGASTSCTVLLSSLDGAPLDRSARILVTVLGDSADTGEIAAIDRSDLASAPAKGRLHPFRYEMQGRLAGRKPMLAEPVHVAVRLRRVPGAPALRCQSLNPAGDVTGAVPIHTAGGWTGIAFDGARYRSIYYLLSAQPGGKRR